MTQGRPRSRSPAVRGPASRLRFALVLAAYGLALLGLRQSPPLVAALSPLERGTAAVTEALLQRSGFEVRREGTVISHPGGFAYEIYYPCTGLTIFGFLVAGLLALPGSRGRKLVAIAAAVPALAVLNQVRLLQLFAVGVEWPQAVELAHGVWEGVLLTGVVVFWLGFTRRVSGQATASTERNSAMLGRAEALAP